jgi:structural maintenance of chromosome 4
MMDNNGGIIPQNTFESSDLLLPESMLVHKAQNAMRRLIIKKIVLENFKSYYGRMEVGPLHSHFTAIVGPNGSGKSNTIEALLFVFGFPSRKMRIKNLSELIHNSATH